MDGDVMNKERKYKNVSVDKLVPYINNTKTHSKEQIKKIQSSIREFGFVNPILIDGNYNIIAGHGRLEGAKAEGLKEVPCLFIEDLTDTQIKAYRIADNRIAEDAEWDMDLLKLEMEDLDDIFTGFDDEEFNDIMGVDKEVVEDDFEVEVPDDPISKLGQVYQLGEHRLMCGNSTSEGDVNVLMNGEKADMVFTDPPYNVNIKGKFTGKIQNDDMEEKDFRNLIDKAFTNIKLNNNGSSYICYEIKQHTLFESYASNIGIIDEIIVWNKDSASFYNNDIYNRKFEAIFFIKGDGNLSCNKETNVWDFPKSSSFNNTDENGLRFNQKGNFLVAHPTSKPVKLVSRALNNSSKKDNIVLDVFGGSGSTLIACEQLDRICYMMELDPKYIDVIINRWETFTGNKAVLLNE